MSSDECRMASERQFEGESSSQETPPMRVRKRDGSLVPVDVIPITKKVARCGAGLHHINPYLIASKAISGIYDGVTTTQLDTLLIQTAAMHTSEEPEYAKLAARLLTFYIDDEVNHQGLFSFSQSIAEGYRLGLISKKIFDFVSQNAVALDSAILEERCDLFEYFGLRTVYDRYLLKHPTTRQVIESSQWFFMRVACGLVDSVEEAKEFYRLISSFEYMPATPTLFNSATPHPQLSSCFLLDSPEDRLESIYQKYFDVALLSKFAGGIGLSFSRIRSRGSLIKGTNGKSNGIVPFLKTLDSSVAAVNQGGKRAGAACVYLETWHEDLLEFLELRNNTGAEAQRTHHLNLANWIPDLFMKRVEADELWSLFDPKDVPHFPDLYGADFESAYELAEKEGLAKKVFPARDVYGRMMKTLAQTGNGWITFKDSSNKKGNQTLKPNHVIHLSNLCTEILEVSSKEETAVCNLGSINLKYYVKNGEFNFDLLGKNVRLAVKYLDKTLDENRYLIPSAEKSNKRWRPVGLGLMGLQNLFFLLKEPFDSPKAKEWSRRIQEEIYFHALSSSCDLAEKYGACAAFEDTRTAQGFFQWDLWEGEKPLFQPERWEELRSRILRHGLRNSLLLAIAPTSTIASITGAYECIEPQLSNLFKRETLSGEFLQVNGYLVDDLRRLGLWNESLRQKIKLAEGSIQDIAEIPSFLKAIYRTVWEIPQRSLIDMAADRAPFIDQGQSLNLFLENPTVGKASSMYLYLWKKGLKTSYYLRSRPATRINKTTVSQNLSEEAQVSCSLENPEICESCQ